MQRVIFLDRDGVINRDPGGWTKYDYVTKWEEFFFIDGSIEALRRLKKAGYKICLISNQAGISKGYFSHDDLDRLNDRMLSEIEKGGGKIDELYYCRHRTEDDCDCRKPKTGMIEEALKKTDTDLRNTFIVGDSWRDVEAGKKMGMKTILVLSGKTFLSDTKNWPLQPDYIKEDLSEAVRMILEEGDSADGKG